MLDRFIKSLSFKINRNIFSFNLVIINHQEKINQKISFRNLNFLLVGLKLSLIELSLLNMTSFKSLVRQKLFEITLSTIIIQTTMQPKSIMQLKDGVHAITVEHIPFVIKVLTNTFLERNQVWKSFTLNKDQMQQFFERTVLLHLQCQDIARKKFGPNFITQMMCIRNGKIASVMHHFEVETYKQVILKSDKEEKLPLFKALQSEGKKLIEGVDLSKYAPGTAVYINFGGVNPEFNFTSNDRLYMLISYSLTMKKNGVRWIIGRFSNIRATKVYVHAGGRIMNEIVFERDGLKFPLYFIELDMLNPKFLEIEKNFHLVEQKYFQYVNQQKPKL